MENFQNEEAILRESAYHAGIFKAFCDESRLRILELLRGGEKCACVLLRDLAISQPTLSHHMKILCESGVVIGRREGKWTHYSLSESGSRRAAALLLKLTTAVNRIPRMEEVK